MRAIYFTCNLGMTKKLILDAIVRIFQIWKQLCNQQAILRIFYRSTFFCPPLHNSRIRHLIKFPIDRNCRAWNERSIDVKITWIEQRLIKLLAGMCQEVNPSSFNWSRQSCWSVIWRTSMAFSHLGEGSHKLSAGSLNHNMLKMPLKKTAPNTWKHP